MSLPKKQPIAASQTDYLNDDVFEANLIGMTTFLRARAQILSGKRELAEDLAQETLAKAWRARRSFRADTNLQAWLFTIMRNEHFSRQRRAWRQVDCTPEFAERTVATPDEQYWTVVLSDTVRALHCLTEEQRQALILVGAGGLSYADAAKASHSAVGTIKSRVARARQALKKILDREEPLPKIFRPAKGAALNEIQRQIVLFSRGRHTAHQRNNEGFHERGNNSNYRTDIDSGRRVAEMVA